MADKKDVISYSEYQALSDTDKQEYETKWNSDGKSGIATRKGTKLPKVSTPKPTAEIKNADPNAKTTETIKNAAHLTELQQKYPSGWYDEKTKTYHYNDKATEARSKAAEEDRKEGRDYKTAKAPSQFELDLRNGKFDSKNTDGTYTYSYDELVEMRNKYRDAGDPVYKKIQAEINKRPEGKAEIAANKKAKEAKAAKAETDSKAADTPKVDADGKPVESALKDTKAEDEALDKKTEALKKVQDLSKKTREELDEEWDALIKKNEDELDKHKNASDLADFLPRFAIQHYLEGNFGKRKSAKALGTLGYFLLDKIGASMVNASQVARGMTPTQKTALEQYNTKMMEAAISRDDKNRTKINEEKINDIIKNSDALRKAGYDTDVTLGNDMASKYLSQHADQIDEQVYLKLKKQAADWYDKLSDSEKMSVDRLFLAMSTDPNQRQKGILQYQLKGYEANAQEDTARAEKAKYEQAEAKAKTKTVERLTKAQAAKAETEIENMKKNGLLTDAQAADAWKMVDIHQKDLDWRDAQEWQKQITGYIGAVNEGVSAVGSVIPF